MFISFANFYQRFIQGFNKIVILFIFLLKIIGLLNLALKVFGANDNKIINSNNGRINKIVVNLSKNEKSRNLTYVPKIRAITKLIFLILNIKKVFNHL